MTAQTAIGWGLSGLFIAFMIFDGAIKLPPIAPVTQTMETIGWPTDAGTARLLGIIGLLCTALYAWPPSAVLGAVLLTGYLGGAIATQLRLAEAAPLFSHKLFGVYLGMLMWGGLLLRLPQLRTLLFAPAS
ncbi:DoxX family protein [Pseudoroseicyclus sp. H15]